MKLLKEIIKTVLIISVGAVVSLVIFTLMALSYRPPHQHNPKVIEAIEKYSNDDWKNKKSP